MGSLTVKQERFVQEYLIDLNATQAAIRAGYSQKTAFVQGSRLLSNAKVAKSVAEMQARRGEEVEITQKYVLDGLREAAERCMQRIPVLDSFGNETGEWKFEAAGALRAFELLGKHLGMFIDRKVLMNPDGTPIDMKPVSVNFIAVKAGG